MSTQPDDGGPVNVIPAPTINGNGDPIYPEHFGMSLRDHFAGLAMQGTAHDVARAEKMPEHAKWAYMIADAMLAARGK